ncbi:MAG TPA: hypothetical protein VNJ28_04645 [Candidatus Limnocylindrales bacterium]|nr:hypothetical protein [Candidatus Limnocylindrales bacterium]
MPAPQPPRWTVVSQTETVDQDAGGSFVPGVRVVVRTRAGDQVSVFVPLAEYRPDRVRELIEARVATLEAVRGLEG